MTFLSFLLRKGCCSACILSRRSYLASFLARKPSFLLVTQKNVLSHPISFSLFIVSNLSLDSSNRVMILWRNWSLFLDQLSFLRSCFLHFLRDFNQVRCLPCIPMIGRHASSSHTMSSISVTSCLFTSFSSLTSAFCFDLLLIPLHSLGFFIYCFSTDRYGSDV